MRILCHAFTCAPLFILSGWKHALEKMGHEWTWMRNDVPVFDQFHTVEPDIFIGTTYELDRASVKCIAARPNLKVVLKANNWGPIDAEIDTKVYPIGISDSSEQDRICRLREQIGKPDLVFNYYHPSRMPETMGYWAQNGVPTIDMQPAADVYNYYPVEPQSHLKCEIGFVGGYWGYKGKNLNKYLVPLCHPIGMYNIKIFGNQIWPVPQYLGAASLETERALYSSATICPNVSEPHANLWGFEVNERVFKLAACKAFCISDHVDGLNDIFTKDEMVIADSPEHFRDLVDMFTKNPDLREQHIQKCHEAVMSGHTYTHRVQRLFETLGISAKEVSC